MSILVLIIISLVALLVMWAWASLLEWLIFQRVFDDPVKGKLTSVAVAWLTTIFSYDWISGNGASFDFAGMKFTAIPAVIVALSGLYRGLKLRRKAKELPDVFE